MTALAVIALQAAAQQPDISIHAVVEARSVRIEKKGEASARAFAQPDGGSTSESSGAAGSRRFELRLDARIADPLLRAMTETPEQPQR